uniref:3'-5' exonuclease domain-containing protein n=2 Tax=Aegilops tauschii subsp. strangulata TaxID=200361 RepID=A0A453F600_AEGTS
PFPIVNPVYPCRKKGEHFTLVVCAPEIGSSSSRTRRSSMGDTYVADVAFGEEVITTTVTSSGAAVEDWVEEVYSMYAGCPNQILVGLDVEWRPSYSRVQNPAALLQLCIDQRCLIFQLLHADYIPDALSVFLMDNQFGFVGVGVAADANRLAQDYDLQVRNLEDLRGVAAEEMGIPELRQAGLKDLAPQVLGVTMQKPRRITMGPWDACCLSDEQIHYACTDAYVSSQIGLELFTGNY